jgi:hypothetical protein
MARLKSAYSSSINKSQAKSTEFCSATLLLLYAAASLEPSWTSVALGTPAIYIEWNNWKKNVSVLCAFGFSLEQENDDSISLTVIQVVD